MFEFWGQLVDAICRPPRDSDYTKNDLFGGSSGKFRITGFSGRRVDLTLVNKKGLRLECSHFLPVDTKGKDGQLPCVVYCHCNSGSRRDAEEAVYILIPLGVSVFTLDFAGSGLSDGQYVTLGANEADDIEVVVAHLRASGKVSTLGLWGRSMGAVTALLYSNRDPSIAGIVVDSPFSKLTSLMLEVVEQQKLPVPRALLKMALGAMKRSVRKKAGFEIEKCSPIDVVSQSFIPALFAHATGDTFIRISHSEKLLEAYAGDKNLIKFDGDHNSRRPKFFYSSVSVFFHNTLQLENVVDRGSRRNGELKRAPGDAAPAEAVETLASQASVSRHSDFARQSLNHWGEQARAGLSIMGSNQEVGTGSAPLNDHAEDPELLMAIQMSLLESAMRQEAGNEGIRDEESENEQSPSGIQQRLTAVPEVSKSAMLQATSSAAHIEGRKLLRGMRSPSPTLEPAAGGAEGPGGDPFVPQRPQQGAHSGSSYLRPSSANEEEAMLEEAIRLSLCSRQELETEQPGSEALPAGSSAPVASGQVACMDLSTAHAPGPVAVRTSSYVDQLCDELGAAFLPVPQGKN